MREWVLLPQSEPAAPRTKEIVRDFMLSVYHVIMKYMGEESKLAYRLFCTKRPCKSKIVSWRRVWRTLPLTRSKIVWVDRKTHRPVVESFCWCSIVLKDRDTV